MSEEVCPGCNGDGDVLVERDGVETYEPCWECDGSGMVTVDE